jgi:hypothetical protein
MKTPGDPDEENYGLGKAIRPKAPEPKEDEYERFTGQHGDRLMRNKRTGAIESAVPKRIEPIPTPVTVEQWDALLDALSKQEEDGYPINQWGVL